MSHIDNRLDTDAAIKAFVKKSDKEDFILYIRHNFNEGEGQMYTNANEYADNIPALGSPEFFQELTDPAMYDNIRSTLLSLAAGLLKEDKEVKKLFLDFIKNG